MADLDSLLATRNHFELFSLPVRFNIDRKALDRTYLELTRATHPDFAGPDAEAQLRAMQTSARVNEAYAVLSDDLKRADYMLQFGGLPSGDVRLTPATLERIFELREALSLAQSSEDEQTATRIRNQAANWLQDVLTQIAAKLDADQADHALRELVSTARYIQRITTA